MSRYRVRYQRVTGCHFKCIYIHYFHNGVFCSIVPLRFVEPLSPQVNLYERQIEEQSSPYPHQW